MNKMKGKLDFKFDFKFVYLWKISSIICLFFLFSSSFLLSNLIFPNLAFATEKIYADCSERRVVESFASSDYIAKMGVPAPNLEFVSVEEANKKYVNFIGLLDDSYKNYLFTAVKVGESDLNGYLTCGLANNSYVICDSKRILKSGNNSDCVSKITEKINGFDNTRDIETCEDFDKTNNACYPENHICNRYTDDITKGFYSITNERLFPTNTANNGKFYIYRKNIKKDEPNKNCNFDFPSCDLYLVNEDASDTAKGYVNVVKSSNGGATRNVNNQKFIDIILGGFRDDALFVYKGYCSLKNQECIDIMKSPAYFKYKISDDNILYYTKNINYNVCNGYLPNCSQLIKTSSPKTLYNNTEFSNITEGGNNEDARISFYETENKIKTYTKEEHLWFANYRQFNGTVCLSIEGTNSNNIKYDIGYCSDLNINGELKYPNGLDSEYIEQTNKSGGKHPNCYLKSCMDLTKDEINKIITEGIKGKKYCSEYYWLSNKYGFKYFPQDKPVYCSDVAGSKLTFENGLNQNKDNCYLRACYSLTGDERTKVIDRKMLNLNNELERMKQETESKNKECEAKYDCGEEEKEVEIIDASGNITKKKIKVKTNCQCKVNIDCSECNDFITKLDGKIISGDFFNPDNLYKYCENKILINSRFDDKFSDVNLNVIRCADLEHKFGYSIPGSRKIGTTSLITIYNTTSFDYLCREDYGSIVNVDYLEEKDGVKIQKRNAGSFKNTIITLKEGNGSDILPDSKNYFNGTSEYYFRMQGNVMYYPSLKEYGISNYLNVCESIDNNILYYNTAVSKILANGGFDPKNSGSIEGKIATNLGYLKESEKNKLLEENVFECKSYKSIIYENGNFTIDCGIYMADDELGKEIISTPSSAGDENMTSIMDSLKTICRDVVEADEPVGEAVDTATRSPRDTVRSDTYNWLVKPVPVDGSNENRDIATNKTLRAPIAYSVEARGCLVFKNYDNNKIAESVEMRLASGIPFNQTNYISTTNFSDLAYKRKKGEKCVDGEISCVGEKIDCVDSSFEKCVNDYYDYLIECIKRPFEKSCYSKQTYIDYCRSIDYCTADNKMNLDDYIVNVSSRFPESIDVEGTNKLKCGFRSDEQLYRDVTVQVKVKYNKDKENKVSMLSGSESDRFRTKIIKDKILVFRDSLVNANSNSTTTTDVLDFKKIAEEKGRKYYLENDIQENSDNFGNGKGGAKGYYSDDDSDGLEDYLYALNGLQFVYFDADKYHDIHGLNKRGGYAFWTIVINMPQICSVSAAGFGLASIFTDKSFDDYYFACLAEPLYEMADDDVQKKRDQFLFYLNNTRNHVLDYFDNRKLPYGVETDSGIIVSANIIDNNNYLYNYYPRHEYIENDIKNKLESNINRDGKRYYHNTILAKDIIRACRLEKLVGDYNVEEDKENNIKKNDLIYKGNNDYKFVYYKLDKFGNRIGECEPKEDVKECLAEELVKCLESYDVSFINHNEDEDDIDDDFVRKDGKHLKKNNNEGETNEFIPVNVVAYTGNKFTDTELMNREECQIDENGNPTGDLSKCRGFKYKELFYTETQSVPIPLFTHPFLFYKLITPKNTPELFDPTFVLKQFCKFSDYNYNNKPAYCKKFTNVAEARTITADFFNPKFRFSYDYTDDVGDTDLANYLSFKNEYDAEIINGNKKSHPYVVQYKSIAEAKQNSGKDPKTFNYMLEKVYDIEGKGVYVPKVCVYELASVYKELNEENGVCVSGFPDSGGVAEYIAKTDSDKCFMIVDNDVACYERNIPFFTNFIFKLDDNSTFYNQPFINVYLRPDNFSYADVVSEANVENYVLRESDRDELIAIDDSLANKNIEYFSTENRVASKAVNTKQGFGLSFERSYCSQMYYDYYTKINSLQVEQAKQEGRSETLINRLKSQISLIETFIIPDCNKENGEEGEFLINENEMKAIGNDGIDSEEKVVVKKTVIVKKYPESYGGFNEICVKDEDIENIFKYYNKQNTNPKSMPKVFAFRDKDKRGRKTKCLLDQISRGEEKCLVANVVYVHCKDEEKGRNDECIEKLDINTLKYSYIKPINCLKLKNDKFFDNVNEDNIEEIEACYKGGFNQLGTVYQRTGDIMEQSCSCVVADTTSASAIDTDLFTIRDMTPREYGLCVDLVKPEFCPAVKYYDETSKYIDDNLVLGLTKEEIDELEKNPETKNNFRQHRWRTEEKISGILPSTFFTRSLGHAEFDSSVYCYGDEDRSEEFYKKNCTGGSRFISGECRGFWRWSEESMDTSPKAICTKKTKGGENIYEYRLVGDSCQRYMCPSIGYVGNVKYTDEKDLMSKTSVAFSADELEYYDNITPTDYKSYKKYEEQNILTIDKRGSNNGYATWKEFESQDYAFIRSGSDCFTGYGPAGSNYAIRNGMINNGSNVSFFDNTDSFKTGIQSFINYVVVQKEYIDGNILNGIVESDYPKRRCNQKGEWMVVEDVYNKGLIDKLIFENNYYFNNDSNFWLNAYLDKNGNNGNYKTTFGGYCERLVCPAISVVKKEGNNIYGKYEKDREQIYSEEVNTRTVQESSSGKYTFGTNNKIYETWNHSGGASWDNVSAPRNSSNKINTSGSNYNISQNVYEIFTDLVDENMIDSEFKYLKKVYGICRTEHGFYNRNTKFVPSNFDDQIRNLDTVVAGSSGVDPRNTPFTSEDSGIKPERVCTSYGIWEGVVNRCFRGCEMMDIYHTGFNLDKVSNMKNFTNKAYYTTASNSKGGYYYIENDDIITMDPTLSVANNIREDRFIALNLDENKNTDKIGGFTRGDYLTGGAKWARTVVNVGESKLDNDISSPKYGLRYVEVEGVCDSSYNTDGESKVRQYKIYNTQGNPKRRCYEDGSWGPVYDDTRCVLAKSCKEFNFSLYDLYLMMDADNKNKTLREKNELLANIITYNKNNGRNESSNGKECNDVERAIGSCFIFKFVADGATTGVDKEATAKQAQSEHPLLAIANGNTTNNNDPESGFANFESTTALTLPIICNQSELDSGETGNEQNVTGWSIKYDDISQYFVPKVCIEGQLDNFDDEIKNLVRSVGGTNNNGLVVNANEQINMVKQHTRYAKGTNLHYLYDFINKPVRNYYINSSTNNPTSLENETNKTVKIGNKTYESYQMYYICNNNYTYNNMNTAGTNGKNLTYKNNHIVLECKGRKDNNNNVRYLIRHHNDTLNMDNPGDHPMHGAKCYLKTCGGGNEYQNNWSKSFIIEAKNNFTDGSSKLIDFNALAGTEKTESEITCPYVYRVTGKEDVNRCKDGGSQCIRSAFVIDNNDPDLNSANVEYFVDDNGKSYRNKGFVSKFKTTCKFNSNKATINGTSCSSGSSLNADLGSLDYQKYGKLEHKGLPTKFYQDIAKERPRTVDEKTIFGSTSFNSSFEGNNNGFCVPMGCRGTDLGVIRNGEQITGIKELTKEEKDSGNYKYFTLKNQYYGFGEYVIVQSIDGDFINDKSSTYNSNLSLPETSIPKDNLLFITGTKNSNANNQVSNSVCDLGEDPYTLGTTIEFFDVAKYCKIKGYPVPVVSNVEDKSTEDEPLTPYEKTYTCFNYLETSESISYTPVNNYITVTSEAKTAYIKLKPEFNKLSEITNIYNNINSYQSNTNTLKNNTVEFIVDKLVFDGINRNTSYTLPQSFESEINKRIQNAIIKARTNTENYIKSSGNNSGLYCYYDVKKENTVLKEPNTNGFNEYIIPISKLTASITTKVNDYISNSGKNLETLLNSGNIFAYNGLETNLTNFAGIPVNNKEQTSNCGNKTVETVTYKGVQSVEQKYKIYCESEGFNFNKTTNKCEKTIYGVRAVKGEEVIVKKPIEKPTETLPTETPKEDNSIEGSDSSGTTNGDIVASGDMDGNTDISGTENTTENNLPTETSNENDSTKEDISTDIPDNEQNDIETETGKNDNENNEETEYEEVKEINWESTSECISKEIFDITETINDESVATDQDGTKWKKTNEGECVLGTQQEDVKLDYNNHICFYNIDETDQDGSPSSYKPVDDINELYQINNNIGDKEFSGDIYRSDGGHVNSCASRNFQVELTKDVNGYYIQDVDIYNNKYNLEYATAINEAKEQLKKDILANTSNSAWKDLYDEYYNAYDMEGLMKNNFNDFSLYTSDYADNDFESDSIIPEMVNVDGKYYFAMVIVPSDYGENESSLVNNGKFVIYDHFSKYDNKYVCLNINNQAIETSNLIELVRNNKNNLSSNSCTNLSASERSEVDRMVNGYYKDYYLNFLTVEKPKIKKLKESNESLIKFCYDTYVDYAKEKYEYELNLYSHITSTFRSGLFLGLQCTDEGWKVADTPYCKKRCSGTVGNFNLKPVPLTTYKFNLKVDNLRYSKAVRSFVWGRSRAANNSGGKNTRFADAVVSCGENGTPYIDNRTRNNQDGKGVIPNFNYKYYWKKVKTLYHGNSYREGILNTVAIEKIECGSGDKNAAGGDYICTCNGQIDDLGSKVNVEVVDIKNSNW